MKKKQTSSAIPYDQFKKNFKETVALDRASPSERTFRGELEGDEFTLFYGPAQPRRFSTLLKGTLQDKAGEGTEIFWYFTGLALLRTILTVVLVLILFALATFLILGKTSPAITMGVVLVLYLVLASALLLYVPRGMQNRLEGKLKELSRHDRI